MPSCLTLNQLIFFLPSSTGYLDSQVILYAVYERAPSQFELSVSISTGITGIWKWVCVHLAVRSWFILSSTLPVYSAF